MWSRDVEHVTKKHIVWTIEATHLVILVFVVNNPVGGRHLSTSARFNYSRQQLSAGVDTSTERRTNRCFSAITTATSQTGLLLLVCVS